LDLHYISCQYQFENVQHQQNFIPSSHFPPHQHNFHIQHPHPTPTPASSHHQNHNFNSDQFRHHQQQQQHHHSHHNQNHNQQQPSSVQQNFDLNKFNQQTKQLQAQIHYLNQQQAKHIQNQINSVHQQNSEPHFDFVVNGNYSDLEKASEQFVNYGRLANNIPTSPKVIKITKTLAVKQPIPVPYPVPVVKVIKEQIPVETSHSGYHGLIGHSSSNSMSPATTTQRPYEEISYVPHRPTKMPSHSAAPATSYQSFASSTTPSPPTTPSEYDTEPFYIRGPHKEMIKIVPVPYYVDEHGNKHEIKTSSSSSLNHESTNTNGHEYYTNLQHTAEVPTLTSSSSTTLGGEGEKFKTFSYSYHPSSPQHHNNHAVYAHEAPSNPEEEYYYHHENRDSEQGASESHHQHSHPSSETIGLDQQQQLCSDDFGDEYRYKYLTYEQ
jgi:exonuclease VII large subunit